jgi:hypothetical protein
MSWRTLVRAVKIVCSALAVRSHTSWTATQAKLATLCLGAPPTQIGANPPPPYATRRRARAGRLAVVLDAAVGVVWGVLLLSNHHCRLKHVGNHCAVPWVRPGTPGAWRRAYARTGGVGPRVLSVEAGLGVGENDEVE